MEFDVKHIAKLAMLKFSDSEAEEFEHEFASIVRMVEHLPEMDAKGALLDPAHQMDLREDEVVPSMPRSELLSNVPHLVAGCVVVPKTVE